LGLLFSPISNLATIAFPKIPISCAYFSLYTQEGLSYTFNPKKQALINQLNSSSVIIEAAKAVLRVIEEEKLVEKARLQGNYLKERLLGLQKKYPLIGDVRGMGLMVGLELVTDARKTPAKENGID